MELNETERAELARLIQDGFTSGILDSDDGVRITWKLDINKFDTN
jgi:hypothetical protein